MQDVYKVVMKLNKEHPEIVPKMPRIYGLMKKGLPVSMDDLERMGVTKEDVAILVEYGMLRKEAIK